VIQNPAVIPVLADGLFVHTSRPAEPFAADVDIPNINCPKCTLQVIQFMAEHGLMPMGTIPAIIAQIIRSPQIPGSQLTRAGQDSVNGSGT